MIKNILSSEEKGSASLIVILLLLAGIGIGAYLIQKPTNLLPKAATLTEETYTLMPSTASSIILSEKTVNPKLETIVSVSLKDKYSNIVSDQREFVYRWVSSEPSIVSVSATPFCSETVQTPCPRVQAELSGLHLGSSTIQVTVSKRGEEVAQASFRVMVLSDNVFSALDQNQDLPAQIAGDRGPFSKVTFIHYRSAQAAAKNQGGSKGSSTSCFSYIVDGAKWKTTKDYIINPNGSNQDSLFVKQAVESGVAEWEKYGTPSIFGLGILDSSSLAGLNNDGKNVLSFGPYSDNNAIAVTSIWGYFSGPTKTRELTEWDMLFNTAYLWGNADTGSSVMDLQNIATHELGHSAGMGDLYSASCTSETMFGYSGYGEVSKRDLNSGDILGISKLYR